MVRLSLPDKEFEQALILPDLIDQYRTQIMKAERRVKREFWRDADLRRSKKRDGIETEKRHRMLLNLSVFPFTMQGLATSLGYQFVRGSPLAELNVSNFDFMIARISSSGSLAIFGEVKGSIQDPDEAVSQTLNRRAVALGSLDYVKKEYLGLPSSASLRTEFVISCPSSEVTEVVRAVTNKNPKLIVWHASLSGPEILKIASPPNVPDRHLMLHTDKELNDLLTGAKSSFSCYDLWPKMHLALSLGATYKYVERGQDDMFVTDELVRAVVSTDMFYLSEREREAEASKIIQLAREIGFIAPVPGTIRYRVGNARERRDATERRAYSRWIDYSLNKELGELLESERNRVQDEFREIRARQKGIDEY